MQDKLFRQAALEKLSSPEELDQLMQVTTPRGWFALAGLIGLVLVALIVGVVGVIPIQEQAAYCLLTNDTSTNTVSAVLYLPYGKSVQAGDDVHIALAERSGFLLGSVKSAGDFPVADEDMATMVGNRTLVTQLLNENGSLIQVDVDLIPDESVPGNYQWSSGQSAGISIQTRLRCDGDVTVERVHPIQLILRGS